MPDINTLSQLADNELAFVLLSDEDGNYLRLELTPGGTAWQMNEVLHPVMGIPRRSSVPVFRDSMKDSAIGRTRRLAKTHEATGKWKVVVSAFAEVIGGAMSVWDGGEDGWFDLLEAPK